MLTCADFELENHRSRTYESNNNDEEIFREDPLDDDSSPRQRLQPRRESFFNLVDDNTSYDDLTPIDWDREFAKERKRSDRVRERGSWHWLYDKSQVWMVLVLSGIFIGFLASMIDVVSQWLAGLRFGYCKSAFYLSRQFCCLGIDPNDKCENWRYWASPVNHSILSYLGAYSLYIILSVGFATAASMLVLEIAPYARRSGISEIKTLLGGFVIKGFLGLSTLTTKTIGLCLVVGAGLWVGKEGPLVHVACCCANLLIKFFPPISSNEARKREVLSAASAAGISVAFGSPVGGVLFMLEQLSFYANHTVMWHAFVCAMVASVTLQTINPFRSGKLVLFQVIFDRAWHKFELIPFGVVGALGGIYGTMIVKLNMLFARWRENGFNGRMPPGLRKLHGIIQRFPLIEVGLVAGISALLNFPDIYTRLQSSVLLSYLFEECTDSTSTLCNVNHWFSSLLLLSLAAIIGTVLTSYSFGMAIPAGMLMPSMLVGALGGRGVGLLIQAWQEKHPGFFIFASACPPDGSCITPGVYSVVGAASALAGATRLTVTSVVIMFELTGALTYVIPIMAGVMVSKWVADFFSEEGIYESWITFLKYPMMSQLEDGKVPEVPVSDVMTSSSETYPIYGKITVQDIERLLDTTEVRGFPIVSNPSDMSFVGYISRKKLLSGIGAAKTEGLSNCKFIEDDSGDFDLRPWADLTPLTLSSESTLHIAVKMAQVLGMTYIVFTDRGRFSGLLTRKDISRLLRSLGDLGEIQLVSTEGDESAMRRHLRTRSEQRTGLLDIDSDDDNED